jgi:ectoine hydroxylase-related dioxygenase (phytanoyl-CoA dioxygenase family)
MGARDAASPVRSLDVARARATWTALDEAIRGDAGAWTFDDDDDDARATTSGREERDAGDAIRALGYAIVPRCANRALARRVATLARGLAARGLDPTYVFVYEDAWTLLRTIETACKSRGCFGGLIMNYDVLAWCVDPVSDGEATTAFCPHRDRQPDDSPGSFSENGDAKYATAWVALANDATPENSCLYCVPRPHDPGYYDGDDDDANAKDPLSVALDSKKAFQYVRALPCKAGDGVVFTHRLIHWGSIGEGR